MSETHELVLVRGRSVVCAIAAGSGSTTVVDDGAVVVIDGRVREIGTWADVSTRYPGATVYGGADDLVIPGLVNAHHHLGLTPFQLGSPDLPLELWNVHRAAERDVDPYLDTLYGAFELVESGVTAVQHLHRGASGATSPEGWLDTADAVMRAYADVGMRVAFSFGLRDRNYLVYEDDDAFVGRLPADVAAPASSFVARRKVAIEAQLECAESILRDQRVAPDPLVRVHVAPTNPVWCSDTTLERAADLAIRYGTRLNMHVLETVYQHEWARRAYGTSAIRHLADVGLLGATTTLSHVVWASTDDVELLAETDTVVCHNASSNLRLRSGLAAGWLMAARGVTVALGIDETGLDDRKDMLEEMRLVLTQQQRRAHNSISPTAEDVFAMCTQGGARSTGFAPEIGTLEPGRAADVVVLDWQQIAAPFLETGVTPIAALLRRAKPPVKSVLVAGRPVYVDGRFVNVDRDAAMRELSERLGKPRTADEQARRDFADQLMPHVRRFYASWLDGHGGT